MMARQQAIATILARVGDADLVLTSTGMISREAFSTDDRPGNFYMLGSMGLLSSLGLGLALLAPQRRVWVLDGDGSALMSLGTLPLIATASPPNLIHVILDNEAYESTGGQPSISATVDLAAVAEHCGYPQVHRVTTPYEFEKALPACAADAGPHLVLVKVAMAPVEGMPRVSHPPTAIRDRFKTHLQSDCS